MSNMYIYPYVARATFACSRSGYYQSRHDKLPFIAKSVACAIQRPTSLKFSAK